MTVGEGVVVVAGLRIGATLAVIGVVVGELVGVAAVDLAGDGVAGLGVRIAMLRQGVRAGSHRLGAEGVHAGVS